MKMDEKHLKVVILSHLYQSEIYFIRNEPEMNKRYLDIMLLERNPFQVEHQFLFELKIQQEKRRWKRRSSPYSLCSCPPPSTVYRAT